MSRVTSETLSHCDVCILGAGLAGLTLARQLHERKPELSIVLVEHRRYPVPEAIHKVGESTVEIAAHYLSETLHLKSYLTEQQLPKFGLRLFLRGEHAIEDDLAKYDEIGVSKVLPIPTFQVDRGRLENHLAETLAADGVNLLSGTTLRAVGVSPGAHRITVRGDDGERTLQARYIVDGSGRRAWLRGQRHLNRPARHPNCAVWFRIEGKLELDEWSVDEQWRDRCCGTPRRLSTNHFTGPGYWLWLIPLASNMTSVGVVFDPRILSVSDVHRHENLIRWLRREHPLVASRIEDARPLDFHVLKDYAVGCSQVFSEDGWMLTGDAGVFADPFYSPGADFIAFSNGYITELIAENLPAEHYRKYQSYFLAFNSNTLSLYRGQYGGFGNRDLMVLKTIWDYSYYWGSLAKLFFSGRYLDVEFMDSMQPVLLQAGVLNSGMQRKFRQMSRSRQRVGGDGKFFDHNQLPFFHRIKDELLLGDSDIADQQLEASVENLRVVSDKLTELIAGLALDKPIPALDQLGQLSEFA